jgi:shikimate kinase
MGEFRLKNGKKSIVFIGFMGVGKTTIGKLVAKKLNRSFIDIDEEIEKEYQLPVPQIFNQMGEKAFRQKEKELISRLAEEEQKIISVGGGAFLQEEIRQVCLSSCIVVHLNLSLESWKKRVDLLIDSRPVLQGKSPLEMEELFYSRKAIYSQHHVKIETDDKAPNQIADEIIDIISTNFGIKKR